MSTYVPRIKGVAFPVGKQWGFEIQVCIGELDPIVLSGTSEEFLCLNRKAALTKMREMIPEVAKVACEAAGLPPPTGFHDLIRNRLDPVDELASVEEMEKRNHDS